MVAAWMRALTGFGLPWASGSQIWSGLALLPTAPQRSRMADHVAQNLPRRRWCQLVQHVRAGKSPLNVSVPVWTRLVTCRQQEEIADAGRQKAFQASLLGA